MKKFTLTILLVMACHYYASSQNPYLGEIRLFAGNFAPRGWALCNGQLLSINQNQALFSLLGTYYGGDGRVTFALPNMQGRVPIQVGDNFTLGQSGGELNHTITLNELPAHTHTATVTRQATKSDGTQDGPNENYPAVSSTNAYGATADTNMEPITTSTQATGASVPVNNMQPYLVLNYIISLQGLYPSRD